MKYQIFSELFKSRRIFAKRVQRVLAYRHIMYWRGIQFALCVRTTRLSSYVCIKVNIYLNMHVYIYIYLF